MPATAVNGLRAGGPDGADAAGLDAENILYMTALRNPVPMTPRARSGEADPVELAGPRDPGGGGLLAKSIRAGLKRVNCTLGRPGLAELSGLGREAGFRRHCQCCAGYRCSARQGPRDPRKSICLRAHASASPPIFRGKPLAKQNFDFFFFFAPSESLSKCFSQFQYGRRGKKKQLIHPHGRRRHVVGFPEKLKPQGEADAGLGQAQPPLIIF